MITLVEAFTAVDHVDFDVCPAECFGFLGPNGAGKTTTMRMIYGVSPITSGRLQVLGLHITRGPTSKRRSASCLRKTISIPTFPSCRTR